MAAALITPDTTPLPRPVRLARLVAVRLRLRPPVDIVAVIRLAEGLRFREMPLDTNDDGLLAYSIPKDRFGIVANIRYRDPLRRRFTLAHELGHYVLHRQLIREHGTVDAARIPQLEAEASAFASELLMPEAAVRDYLRFHFAHIDYEIRRAYGVSMSAWYRRLADLGHFVHPRVR